MVRFRSRVLSLSAVCTALPSAFSIATDIAHLVLLDTPVGEESLAAVTRGVAFA